MFGVTRDMKVLLCDDSMTVRKKVGHMIQFLTECTILEAINGQDAIEQYEEHNPDLVFMDITMPIKDGLEAVAEIMTLHQDAHIVMLSSVGTKSNLEKALKFGAKDFLQKPIDTDELKRILTQFEEEQHV